MSISNPYHLGETNTKEPITLHRYLKRLGISILVIGCLASFVLALTIIVIKAPGYNYITEFSLSGLIITISILLGSIFIHAIFSWLAGILRATEDIRDILLSSNKK